MIILSTLLFSFYHVQEPQIKKIQTPERNPNIWVSAYLSSWQHNAGTPYSNWGAIRTGDIDWSAITHLFYFALNIGPNGRPSQSFDPKQRNNFNADRLNAIVPEAHRHSTKILFSVGGAGNYSGFSSAIRREHRQQFINTIVQLISTYGFDGVDLDMEPIEQSDFENFKQFVFLLHREFAQIKTRNGKRPLITIAALKGSEISAMYASIQKYVDQINIMTYDMAQPWRGWQAWHNSALFSDGVTFDYNGREMSSVNQKVQLALNAGIQRQKLGIGIDFYGYIWHHVNLLGKWKNWPTQNLAIIERPGGVPYSELYKRFPLSSASWDEQAQTSYLNIDNPKTFVSFDNQQSVGRKVQYCIDEGLGGVILWELGGGYLDGNSVGPRDPLLQAVKSTVHSNLTQ